MARTIHLRLHGKAEQLVNKLVEQGFTEQDIISLRNEFGHATATSEATSQLHGGASGVTIGRSPSK